MSAQPYTANLTTTLGWLALHGSNPRFLRSAYALFGKCAPIRFFKWSHHVHTIISPTLFMTKWINLQVNTAYRPYTVFSLEPLNLEINFLSPPGRTLCIAYVLCGKSPFWFISAANASPLQRHAVIRYSAGSHRPTRPSDLVCPDLFVTLSFPLLCFSVRLSVYPFSPHYPVQFISKKKKETIYFTPASPLAGTYCLHLRVIFLCASSKVYCY